MAAVLHRSGHPSVRRQRILDRTGDNQPDEHERHRSGTFRSGRETHQSPPIWHFGPGHDRRVPAVPGGRSHILQRKGGRPVRAVANESDAARNVRRCQRVLRQVRDERSGQVLGSAAGGQARSGGVRHVNECKLD